MYVCVVRNIRLLIPYQEAICNTFLVNDVDH